MRDNTNEFKIRLARYLDELHWVYGELYNLDDYSFHDLCDILSQAYDNRSEKLKSWDRARMQVYDWYSGNEMFAYSIQATFLDKIKSLDNFISYLKELGVNYLHLHTDYNISDSLDLLINKLHDKGICLSIDYQINYTSSNHPWALKAKNGNKDYQKRYFMFDNWKIPREFEKNLKEFMPESSPGNFTWNNELQKVIMTRYNNDQWDLNYNNPKVFNDMVKDLLSLCNKGADIIHLEDLPYIYKRLGSDCENLSQVHSIARVLRIIIDVVCPGTLLLADTMTNPRNIAPYFGTVEKPECHVLYNIAINRSIWHTVATRDTRLLRYQLDHIHQLPKQYTFVNYLRGHESLIWTLDFEELEKEGMSKEAHISYLNRYFTGSTWDSNACGVMCEGDCIKGSVASLCGLELAVIQKNAFKLKLSMQLDMMLHAFIFTLRGIPVILGGDELGYTDTGMFDESKVSLRKKPETKESQMYHMLKQFHHIRESYNIFENDADMWTFDTGSNQVLGIGRYLNDEKLLAVFNFSEHKQTVKIQDLEDFNDLLKEIPIAKEFPLEPYSFKWLMADMKKEDEMNEDISI